MEAGIYFRVKRDQWENLDITELTGEELESVLALWDWPAMYRTIKTLSHFLKEVPE